jgi:hypothetical protein
MSLNLLLTLLCEVRRGVRIARSMPGNRAVSIDCRDCQWYCLECMIEIQHTHCVKSTALGGLVVLRGRRLREAINLRAWEARC